jgi:hypothetical protein
MSVQNPTIPTATQAKGIDAVILDLQTHLDTELVWLTNGMGRAYRLTKVEVNRASFFLPEVYLGGANQWKYFAATPDNDKKGQSIFVVGNETYVNQQSGFFGVIEYPVSIIFSTNLELINSTLLETDYFEEHQIEDVRQALIRDLLGKSYKLTVDEVVREFDDVYTEFDVTQDRGIAHAPMSYFRFNCTVQVREDCLGVSLDRCAAILQNLSATDMCNCVIPSLDFTIGVDTDFDCFTGQQITDLTTRLCPVPVPPNNLSTLFDGVNESVRSPYNVAHELERTDLFSMDCWIKQPAFGGTNTVIAKYDIIGVRRGYYLQVVSNGAIRFGLSSDEGTTNQILIQTFSGFTTTANAWNHIALTYTGSSLASGFKIYINGIVAPSLFSFFDSLTGTTVDPSNVLTFGTTGTTTTADEFNGNLFNAHVWKGVVLTPAEVAAMAATPVISSPVQPTFLTVSNRLGGGSLFGFNARVYPDDTGIVSGYQSVNI